MKIITVLLWSFVLLLPLVSIGQDSTKTEKALRVVPLITSSPLMGFGVGRAAFYLYNTDAGVSSKSQLQIGGRCALQPKTGVDLRLDLVRTGEGDYAFYLMLNQAC